MAAHVPKWLRSTRVGQAPGTFVPLRKKLLKKEVIEPLKQTFPYLYENGTKYTQRHLDDQKPFQPIVVHSTGLEKRHDAFLKAREEGAFPELDAPPIPFGEWDTKKSCRAGMIFIKVKMYRFWDEHGNQVPCTMLWAPNCSVINNLTPNKSGRWGLTVAAGFDHGQGGPLAKQKIDYTEAGTYKKLGTHIRHVNMEFTVSEDAMLPPGFQMGVRHFVPGQYVDVTGQSTPKGFEGVMKRWGFRGGPASHGSTKFHRRPGSIGSIGQKVQKGKKMPGHMGGKKCTQINRYVHMIDYKNNLLYVHGSVPGKSGKYVYVRDCFWKDFGDKIVPPFPSYLPDPDEDLSSKSFEECQIVAPSQWTWHLDFGHPSQRGPM